MPENDQSACTPAQLSLGHMAFALLAGLRYDFPDQLYTILRSAMTLPPEEAVGATYPPNLILDGERNLTFLGLINSLLVAAGEPKVAIVCGQGPAGEVLQTVSGVVLLGPNNEVLYGSGDEGGEAPEETGGSATAPCSPPSGDSG